MAKPKILVVDDEPDVVEMIVLALTGEGFEVVQAYDGLSALDMVESEQPDLVLLDIMMPMMSGYQVCEQLKANPLTKDIPIVCLTSASAPDVHAKSIQLGAVGLMEKPFLPSELADQVRRFLKI